MLNFFGKKLRAENVVEQWQTLIPKANGKGEQVYKDIVSMIEMDAVPHLALSRRGFKAEREGISRSKYEFLVVKNTKLKNYDTYINARDYGNQLFVSWYVIREKPGFMRSLKHKPIRTIIFSPFMLVINILSWFMALFGRADADFARGAGMFNTSPLVFVENFNLFDQQEISAYISTVHGAVKESVNRLTRGIDPNFAKIDMRTRGFLNLS